MRIDLVPFSPCLAVQALRYTLISESSSELRLTVQLKGSIASELEDVDQVGQREFGLWQHHCFELFLGEAGSTAYWELNLAPNGNWNCFGFSDYRQDQKESDRCALTQISATGRGPTYELEARILTNPSFQTTDAVLSLGAAATIKTATDLHYFSIRHGVTPDFHHRDHHIPWKLQ
jgi:hypothetical protein